MQQEQNNNDSVQDDSSTKVVVSTAYIHPYFKHDEQGNLKYVNNTYFDSQKVLGDSEFPKIETNSPLTKDFLDEQIIAALNWFWLVGPDERLYYFLDNHFGDYRSALLRDDSDQPFFQFLFHLVKTTKHPLKKNIYDAVINWIHEHPLYDSQEILTESDGDPQSKNPLGLSYKEIALLYIYSGLQIVSHIKADEIAASYGGKKKSRGKQLFEEYNNLQLQKNRTGLDGSKARHLMKSIKKILPLLNAEHAQLAEKELSILQDKI